MFKATLPNNIRRVQASKLPDSRVGIGLVRAGPHGRHITIAEIFAHSPLEGLVFPGDIICGVAGAPLPASVDAKQMSNTIHLAQDLDLSIETPAPLADARTVFLIPAASHGGELGLHLEKDISGLARVSSLAPGSLAATAVDRSCLAPGDLIVAVGYDGGLYQVSNLKEASAKLQAATGAIELRVVRPGGWPATKGQRPGPLEQIHSPRQASPPPPAYDECGSVSALTSLLERSRVALPVHDELARL